jgi:hypothetical protein
MHHRVRIKAVDCCGAAARRVGGLLLAMAALGASAPAAGQDGQSSAAASTEIMPLADVRVGMRGVGYTVVQGTEPEAFEFEILGILENTFPKQSLIVARLSGLGFEEIGIAGGMSGSPAYVDGKLIGAVSYRLGSFPTEPVAGITPIENMLQISDAEAARTAVGQASSQASGMLTAAADLLGGRPADLAMLRPASAAAGIAPIATPVTIGGVDPELVRRISPLFETMGWQPSLGGTSQNEALNGPLEPGSAVAVQLMRGDVTFTAVGTVTWVDGDRVLAFGHPFLQGGSVDFPMAAAEVLMVLPSLADSQKLTAGGSEVLGSIRQDRQAGIFGVVGAPPPMVPVAVSVGGDGVEEEFNFEMVADKSLSPTFLFMGLANALQSVATTSGDSALEVSGEFNLGADYEPVRIENRFSSPAQAFFAMAQTISSIYQFLYDNPFHPVEVRSVNLDISLRGDLRVAEITRVWADRVELRPGESLELSVWLKPYRQPEVQIDIELQVPDDLTPGPVSILVGDAGIVSAEESSFVRGDLAPQSVEQIIRLLNRTRPSDRIYYQLSRTDEGAFYGGRRMPSLPPSVLDILSNSQTSGESIQLSKTVLHEASEPVEYVVSGEHRIELNVRRR